MINLKILPLLASSSEAEANTLLTAAEVIEAAPGDVLFPDYAITDSFWVLIEGRWRVTRRVAGDPYVMFEADRPGTWTGGIPVIDAIAAPKADVLAPARFLKIPTPVLEDLAGRNPPDRKTPPRGRALGRGPYRRAHPRHPT